MRRRSIQTRFTTGRFTLPVVVLICILFCGVGNVLFFPYPTEEITYPLWKSIYGLLPPWGIPMLSFVLFAFTGYSLIELNNRFSIIGIRASVQTSLYLMLITAIPHLYSLHAGSVTALFLLLSIHFLFKTYQAHRSSGNLFHSFAFLGIGSLFFPQITLLIPFWWITAYRFQSLTFRSFCATLVGWSFPYWFLFGYAFFHQKMELFYQPFIELANFHPIDFKGYIQLWEMGTLGFIALLFIVSTLHCFIAGYRDKIRTRVYLTVLMQVGFALFLLGALQPAHFEEIIPSLLVVVSILSAHFFGLTNSRTSNIFFIATLVLLILLYAFNIWTLF